MVDEMSALTLGVEVGHPVANADEGFVESVAGAAVAD